ncbi:MAG: RagB/SusD family nutrient uptake outer membrane protein [Bacteroidales bacterium]|nr:MAG: RagB/SusD family nutrient uptake outer membrane protein [Bacteroidales bacterium]
MKKITIILPIIFLFTACTEDFLDITPKNNLSDGNYYKNQDHTLAAITSAYDVMTWMEFYGVFYALLLEGAGDDCIPENSRFKELTYNTDEGTIAEMYMIIYMGIMRSNMVLEKVPAIEMDEELKNRILGEAKFLRAFYNWHLVTLWGEAPLITEVLTLEEQTQQSKNTTGEIWNQIETDLLGTGEVTGAIDLLPETHDPSNVGRASKGAAIALLAKSYLYQERWQEASDMFDRIIEKDLGGDGIGGYGLVQYDDPQYQDSAGFHDAYLSVFLENPFAGENLEDGRPAIGGENSKESVFEVQYNDYLAFPDGGMWLGWGNAGTFRNLYFGATNWGAYRNLCPSESFVNEFEAGDPRKKASVFSNGDIMDYRPETQFYMVPFDYATSGSYSQWIMKKTIYPIWYLANAAPINFPLIRYADVLLMKAEALINLGDEPGAAQFINRVRQRVGAPVTIPWVEDLISSSSSISDLKDALIHERRVELGLEIHRTRDLIRWSSPTINWVRVSDYNQFFVAGKHEYFPIPQYEIDISEGNLVQNPNWN